MVPMPRAQRPEVASRSTSTTASRLIGPYTWGNGSGAPGSCSYTSGDVSSCSSTCSKQQVAIVGVEPLDDATPLRGGAAVDVSLVGEVDATCRPGVRPRRCDSAHVGGVGDVEDHRLVGLQTVRIDVFTIFPGLVESFCTESLLGKARTQRPAATCAPTTFASTRPMSHRTVDDAPFGGGAGMVMKPEPIFASVEAADPPRPLYLLGPGGRRFDQAHGPRTGRRVRASACCAAATRASTTGSASISSTTS